METTENIFGYGLPPEQRTSIFFDSYVDQLADRLLASGGMEIAIPESDRRVRIVEVEPFAKDPESNLRKVGKRWKAMEGMRAGQLWNPLFISTLQSLVVSKDRAGIGACVRITLVEYFDQSKNIYVPEIILDEEPYLAKEGYIGKYLELNHNDISELRFLDDTNVLYLITQAQKPVTLANPRSMIDPRIAGEELARLCSM